MYGSVAPVSSAPSGFRGSPSIHPSQAQTRWLLWDPTGDTPSGDAPARHPGRLYCHSSLPGLGAVDQLAQAESEARRLLPAGCSAPGLARPAVAVAHALQVGAPGVPPKAGRALALPAGGAALARPEAPRFGARPSPAARSLTGPSSALLSRNCDPTSRPLWDLHSIPSPKGLL